MPLTSHIITQSSENNPGNVNKLYFMVLETLFSNETKPTKLSQITDQNFRNEANAKREFSVLAKRISNS